MDEEEGLVDWETEVVFPTLPTHRTSLSLVFSYTNVSSSPLVLSSPSSSSPPISVVIVFFVTTIPVHHGAFIHTQSSPTRSTEVRNSLGSAGSAAPPPAWPCTPDLPCGFRSSSLPWHEESWALPHPSEPSVQPQPINQSASPRLLTPSAPPGTFSFRLHRAPSSHLLLSGQLSLHHRHGLPGCLPQASGNLAPRQPFVTGTPPWSPSLTGSLGPTDSAWAFISYHQLQPWLVPPSLPPWIASWPSPGLF